jgi:PTH1 family peptidyl-tRNA hydrolase
MTQIKLIVGLGNPGPEYENTRHNAGAIFLAQLAESHKLTLKPDKKFFGLHAKLNLQGQDIHLLFPTTFMNRSGQAVNAICQFYKIQPEEVLVAHDELDIPCGTMKLKKGGGHGGNNGLRDIIEKFGGNKEFKRLRIGINHPGHASKVTGHVLSKPSAQETEQLTACIDEADRHLSEITLGDWQKAMQIIHSFKA